MRIGLNGRCFGAELTGVQRLARGLLREVAARTDSVLLLPRGTAVPNGGPAPFGRILQGALPGRLWEQLELGRQAGRAGCDVTLHPANCAPRWGDSRPHVMVVHDASPLTHPGWFTRSFVAWYRFTVAEPAARAARILTFSRWARDQLVETLRLRPDRVEAIAPGPEGIAAPASPDAVSRTRDAFRLQGPYVLAVGAGDPRKNLGFLAEVARVWPETGGEPLEFVMVGEPAPHVHPRAAGELPSGAGLRRLGRVSDVELQALYTGAVALGYPSLEEGLGLPPLEALACGTPALVAPYGAARETLGVAGWILPLERDAWLEALGRLLADPAERRRRAEAGRRHALGRSWDAGAARAVAACGEAAEDR